MALASTCASKRERGGSILVGLANSAFLGVTIISTNVLQSASLIFRPFSQGLFRRCVYGLAAGWFSHFVWVLEKLNRYRIVWTGTIPPPGERCIVFANHQTMVDVPLILALAKRRDGLRGFKCFAKKSLKYLPGIGWGMWWLDFPLVKRNWEKDRDHIAEVFATLRTLPGSLWFTSFVEGTRKTPAKHSASRAYAEKIGDRPFEHVMYPRTRGFVASVGAMRDQLDAVYDVTLAYPDGVPSLWQVACHRSREAHVHVRRFPIDALPRDEKALAQWLVDRFRVKDAMLDRFVREGILDEGKLAADTPLERP
jgi:1-acyl-sn-glycerol-3-phosphate acyltransferase